jgi:hypothetical protein
MPASRSQSLQENVIRIGQPRAVVRDLYARLLQARWWQLIVLCVVLYVTANAFSPRST